MIRSEPAGSNVTDELSSIDALHRLLVQRHSCRAFLSDPVPDEIIKRILIVAQQTPSWCNVQPWQVVVTRGAATDDFRDGLRSRAVTHAQAPDIAFPVAYDGVYRDRRRACGFQLYDAVGIAHGDREASAKQAAENFRLFGAPHVAIVTTDTVLGTYGAVDCGAYVTTFMLAATALGVACIAQAALASHAGFIRRHLGIPDHRYVLCGISFGYEDKAHPANSFRTDRASIEEVVQWRS
ncbi:nitroreductase [Roseomonas gilardii]|uniref:Nitroreductase n=1 Tax=Roseomonas gilardii TaxID=257708 RepID=A0ABU3MLG2_9PROT|nr:nitroreductase [Roseomonas gilardii]MDT8333863.1 nitroreductase [Roseomonas gilardii]